jgi:FAD binding domain
MDQELLEERKDDSHFIRDYVEKHKKELEELRTKAKDLCFDGTWFIIGDDEYVSKRLQYATTSFEEPEVSPRIILYPAGDEDIQKAMGLCRELGMAIAVRTGGHQYCGYSSTGPVNMQIDLSTTFTQYEYDADSNVLTCGVSHPLGDWAEKNNENGIYLPMGVCAFVNLGGHVHTGGWGMVGRSHGLLADHVLAFDIIFASGEKERIVRPEDGTTEHNDDVYYAVLGGGKGGDFGIVTQWEFSPLRDKDYPNSACYTFAWLCFEDNMEGAVRRMEQLSKLCADKRVPPDYEFILTMTGWAWLDVFPEPVQSELQNPLVKLRLEKMAMEHELELAERGITERISLPIPPMIQMWMCFTNKEGSGVAFDDQWFESFTHEDVCGEPLIARRLLNTPVSEGLAKHFIMTSKREMDYPFVKRARVTMDLPEGFAGTYTERMFKIMPPDSYCQHLVSQMQVYAGGAVAENGKAGTTSYSWREQAFAMGHDSFYSTNFFCRDERYKAEKWQAENDEVFIGQKAFADADMRMFAYTFGDRVLDDVWPYFYDSKEKYERLRKIKGELDPNGLFSADQFSVKPL